jgi:hypothetical protein
VALQSIEEVWRSKVANERRQLHLSDEKSCISLCDNCNVWDEPSDTDHVAEEFAEATNIAAS